MSIPSIFKSSLLLTLRAVLLVVGLFMGSAAQALSSNVVISQVYGGGGNTGAPFNSDFVELFNRGTTAVNLAGWALQYAPPTSSTWAVADSVSLSGTLAAGQYYLIRLGNGGSVGAALPAADATLSTLNINALAGKVALTNTTTLLAVSNPVGLAQVVDFVGYGATTNAFETAIAPTISNTTSAVRVGLDCYETDNNSIDFVVRSTPVLRNTASAFNPCTAVLLGYYRMEEASWPAGVGVLKDASGNSRHGDVIASTAPVPATASPARTGNPGTCGYGAFTTASTSTGRLSIPNLPVDTSVGAQTTVSFWMNWNGLSGGMPIGWFRHDLWFSAGGFGFNSGGNDVYGVASTSLNSVWKHVTAVFTNGARVSNRLYIDGVLQPLTSFSGTFNASSAVVASTLLVGGWGFDTSYKFNGSIDELKVYNGALTQAQVTANYNETHPCGALLSLQKTVAVLCDPVNGTNNPKNIPGAVVQYTLTTTNSGTGSATLTQTIDAVNPIMVFDSNLITGAGTPAAGCNSATGTPTSATGRGFSLDVTGDTRGASYPKFLTTTSADTDGASHSAGNITINYPLAMPVEAGYGASEIKAGESVVIKFNAVVQ
jgi:Lamin Tail Domain/Concanavalin A-like lectin/glucanases superfamily